MADISARTGTGTVVMRGVPANAEIRLFAADAHYSHRSIQGGAAFGAATADANGRAEFTSVPRNTWYFARWHERGVPGERRGAADLVGHGDRPVAPAGGRRFRLGSARTRPSTRTALTRRSPTP